MAYEKQTWANGDTITAPKLNNIEGGIKGMNNSYEKQTWVTGEVITAEKLNHIEDGIANGGSGGGSTYAPSDTGVTLRDYDGTVLGYYTNEEFNALTELPNPPAPQGLVATGWTATLEEAKASLAENGVVALGRMYETASGATEIDIVLPEEKKSPTLGLGLNGTATIDWGDGSAEDTITGTSLTSTTNTEHQYASGGNYTIKVKITEGEAHIIGTYNGTQLLHDPNNISARGYATAIKKVRIGDSVTSIDTFAFYYCYSLALVVIPDSVTNIGNNAFSYCSGLASVVIPDSVTNIGERALQNCYNFASVVIPDSVTSIGETAFQSCYNLASVVIPDSVTSIGNNAFNACHSLTSVVIPDSVTSIGASAFNYCSGLASIEFESSTPPTAGSSAFNNVPTDCVIKVPTGSLSAYTSASNYPSSSTYTYVEY